MTSGGHGVWWDARLRSGQDFGAEIEEALERADCAVVAWSSVARRSLWVRAEANLALETNRLVQVSLDGAKPPLPFTMLQMLDLSNWRGSCTEPGFVQLHESIDAIVHRVPSKVAIERRPQATFGGSEGSVIVGIASLALVILAAGMVGLGAAGRFDANSFGLVSTCMLLVAMLAFAGMLTHIIAIYLASRK